MDFRFSLAAIVEDVLLLLLLVELFRDFPGGTGELALITISMFGSVNVLSLNVVSSPLLVITVVTVSRGTTGVVAPLAGRDPVAATAALEATDMEDGDVEIPVLFASELAAGGLLTGDETSTKGSSITVVDNKLSLLLSSLFMDSSISSLLM